MAAFVPELGVLVIDMSAPFGWAGSPPCYSLFGRAISWLMGSNSPASVSDSLDNNPFFPFEWVDDHILVEPEIDDRLQSAESMLRYAILAVLGPRSINDYKFSDWSDELVVLGLLWNTRRLTVSIPDVKIVKARNRVTDMPKRGRASKTEFYKLLGSLRYVANCLRSAKPFYQRLQKQCTSAPRFGKSKLSAGSLADLKWFSHILDHGCLAELPLGMFGALPPPDVELYMDASNYGLAVLDPWCDSFIQVKFDNEELAQIDEVKDSGDGFSINVREHLRIALSLWTWGAKWNRQLKGNTIHVKCWSDNSSAVTWCNRHHANNRLRQEINRAIGLAEAYFNRRDLVPMGCRKLYMSFSEHFSPVHWPRPQHNSIPAHGHSGHNGVLGFNFPCGYPKIHKNTRINSRFLLRIAGNLDSGNSASTVQSKISHISWHHRRSFGYNVGLMPGHQLAITGMRRSDPPSNSKFPVTTEIIKCLHNSLNFKRTQHRVLWGASVPGFFFLLRRSEYLAQGTKIMPYAIQRSDIKFLDTYGGEAKWLRDADSVVIHFRGSKADQFEKGTSRVLSRSKQRWCCPVLAAWFLVSHRKDLAAKPDSLLCKIDVRTNLQVKDVIRAIQRAAELTGNVTGGVDHNYGVGHTTAT
ncbi:Hypothetical protein PHPALM_17963 [Phytophthora palmivora]|uniref:Reverse transcriptase n=1 Tax=Phytophthora palmivora TaxID=4796 RepID=A0A2P4XKX9_9STRA|nr:Hypothetical protein PHPALM_17963 [Phytophthora palmivora]